MSSHTGSSTTPEISHGQLFKSKEQIQKDLNLAKNVLKLVELEWLQLKEIVVKLAENKSPATEKPVPAKTVNPDDVIGINSEEINPLPLASFSKVAQDKFVASEDESDESD